MILKVIGTIHVSPRGNKGNFGHIWEFCADGNWRSETSKVVLSTEQVRRDLTNGFVKPIETLVMTE